MFAPCLSFKPFEEEKKYQSLMLTFYQKYVFCPITLSSCLCARVKNIFLFIAWRRVDQTRLLISELNQILYFHSFYVDFINPEAMSTRCGISSGANHSAACVAGSNMGRHTQEQKDPCSQQESRLPVPFNLMDFKQCSHLLLGALSLITNWRWIDVGEI